MLTLEQCRRIDPDLANLPDKELLALMFDGSSFGTPELSLVFAQKRTSRDEKSFLVDQPADFWNRLLAEMKQLYTIGFEAKETVFHGS